MTLYVSLIVEGHSEAGGATERLLHRIWKELLVAPIRLQVLTPSRCKRDSFINPKHPEFGAKVEEASLKLTQRLRREQEAKGLLLLLLDAEKDCPVELAPKLLTAAQTVRGDIDITCVFAKQMLENWIVAGASTLAGINDLPDSLPTRDHPENGSGKGWLKARFGPPNLGRTYKETVDAKVFVEKMDLRECHQNSRSFRKLCKELEARLPPPPHEPPPPPESPAE